MLFDPPLALVRQLRVGLVAVFVASAATCAAVAPRAPSAARGKANIGASCVRDEDCATGVCWNVAQYSKCTGFVVCSLACATDAECVEAASKANARFPDRARCGADARCALDGAGLTGQAHLAVCP